MALTVGTRLGPYEIMSAIGVGGMGEVYKARDTRLDRLVAVKILSAEFETDSDRRARFDREAHAVAALNHPHICDLYDVGETASGEAPLATIRFLVMEYLEGQTLEERIVRGPLPAADVLRYAVELADALDHAHRRGLVHRDLKPGNVMLTRAGAKLLDFGISRLQPTPDLLALATVTAGGPPLTAEGAVLGTYPYMAPEQLAGREADARSDMFAFGALLYEMATGRRAFEGTTAATLIGAILHTDPPPVSTLQPLAPPALDRLISRCLAKDPDDRWQTARDLMLELKWIDDHPSAPLLEASTPHRTKGHRLTAIGVLVIVAMAAAAAGAAYLRSSPIENPDVRLPFTPPDGLTLADVRNVGPVTISPDGQRLAFVATGTDGRELLWIRPLNSLAAQALPETDGGAFPFWSPDSRTLGFFAQGKLKRIQISEGPPQTLSDALQPRGGTWSRDNGIIFSAGAGHELYRVSPGGGLATAMPADGFNQERLQPSFLPDGRHFVYYGRPQQYGIYVASLDSPAATLLLKDYSGVAYAPGYLLLLKGTSPGSTAMTLLAQGFDATALKLTGDAQAVADRILNVSNLARGAFSVSDNGTLVYGNLELRATHLTWFDRSGTPLGNVGSSGAFSQPALSRDQNVVGVRRIDPETQDADIWVIDQARGVESRVTTYGNLNFMPVWSPSGTLVFASSRLTPPNLYQKMPTALGGETLLVKSSFNSQPTDWSSDGRYIVYGSQHPSSGWDLMLLPMSVAEAERKPIVFLQTSFNEHLGRVSPDGRWLAYMSNESGSNEVYVQTFPTPGDKWRISTNGGSEPTWRGDGSELFYLAADETLMAVTVAKGASFRASAPTALFKANVSRGFYYEPTYAAAHDGRRFLINTITEESSAPPTKIMLNWPAALSRR